VRAGAIAAVLEVVPQLTDPDLDVDRRAASEVLLPEMA
jgi:hypothetical protein